jgi:hypothetical protein
MSNYASGKNAWSICATCGWRCAYTERFESSYHTFVCPVCFDGDYDLQNHPQNKSPPIVPDPQALRNPRPDTNLDPNQYDDDQKVPVEPGQTPS